MKWLKRILLSLVVLVGVFLIVAIFLPSQVSLSRSIVIEATADKVFPHVNDLKKFDKWSPWANIDPNMKQGYSGPENGIGQKVSWSSKDNNVGTGSQKIVESVANKKVATELDFGEMGTAKSAWLLDAQGSGTKVTWTFKTELGNDPIMRWMGLMFDKWVGDDYEKGLKALKVIVEKQ